MITSVDKRQQREYVLEQNNVAQQELEKFIEKLPKTNIVKLLKEKRKFIKIDDDFSLIPRRKKKIKCPHIDPAFYGKEGYIRKGYDNFLWINKKIKSKWIWEDYISPL